MVWPVDPRSSAMKSSCQCTDLAIADRGDSCLQELARKLECSLQVHGGACDVRAEHHDSQHHQQLDAPATESLP